MSTLAQEFFSRKPVDVDELSPEERAELEEALGPDLFLEFQEEGRQLRERDLDGTDSPDVGMLHPEHPSLPSAAETARDLRRMRAEVRKLEEHIARGEGPAVLGRKPNDQDARRIVDHHARRTSNCTRG